MRPSACSSLRLLVHGGFPMSSKRVLQEQTNLGAAAFCHSGLQPAASCTLPQESSKRSSHSADMADRCSCISIVALKN